MCACRREGGGGGGRRLGLGEDGLISFFFFKGISYYFKFVFMFGRIALSVLPSALFYFLLFYVPPLDDHPQYLKMIYYTAMYFAFQTCLSVSKLYVQQ